MKDQNLTWEPSSEAIQNLGIEQAEEYQNIIEAIMKSVLITNDSAENSTIIGGTFDIQIGNDVLNVPFKLRDPI